MGRKPLPHPSKTRRLFTIHLHRNKTALNRFIEVWGFEAIFGVAMITIFTGIIIGAILSIGKHDTEMCTNRRELWDVGVTKRTNAHAYNAWKYCKTGDTPDDEQNEKFFKNWLDAHRP